MESKTINGETFRARGVGITKLSNMEIHKIHNIVHIDSKPTKYGTYIVTVFNEDTERNYKVYMPARIADDASVGDRFIYNGLHTKSDNSGHKYHSVLWI